MNTTGSNDKNALDRRTVKKIEAFLQERRVRLQQAVSSQVTQRRSADVARTADATVWATESLHDEIQVALMDRQSRQVAQIDAALERLARGEYGLCHDCREFIGLPRLQALPFAQRCSACQTAAELRARRGAAAGPRDRLAIPVEAA